MAFQLNQLVAPAHYPGLSFPALTNPSNPPTTQDVYDAVIYSMRVLADDSLRSTGVRAQCVAEAKRYEYAIIAAYSLYIAQVAVPAPAAGLPLLNPLSEQATLALLATPTRRTSNSNHSD
ncbi:hypothetical protein CPB85DRAFT_1440860 [Mucidula mucida]|nr:hypothetical protein CPB85DRAFT_1440860 [Mucidula mucida]